MHNFYKLIKLNKKSQNVYAFLFVIVGVACAGVLIYILLQSQFVRPFQDDFYYYPPASYQEMMALLNERFNWTGRFTTTFLYLLIGWLQIHWIVPFVSVGVMSVGIYMLTYVLMRKYFEASKSLMRSIAFFFATTFTVALFLVTPSPYSSIFWLSGSTVHFWSYGFVLLFLAFVLKYIFAPKENIKLYTCILLSIATLLIGMLGELAMFSLAAAISVLLLFGVANRSKKVLKIVVASAIGIVGAAYALFFSMGAVIRRGSEESAGLEEVLSQTPHIIFSNVQALMLSLMSNKVILIMILLTVFVIAFNYARRITHTRKLILSAALVTVALTGLVSINFIGVYSSVRLDVAWSRTQAFSVMILIGLITMYSAIAGAYLKQKLIAKPYSRIRQGISTTLLLAVFTLGFANSGFIPYVHQFALHVKNRAVAYDTRDRIVEDIKSRTPIACPVLLPMTHIAGTEEGGDLLPDANHALNIGVQRYYRLPCNVMEKR